MRNGGIIPVSLSAMPGGQLTEGRSLMQLILASGSARRRELMKMCGYDFAVIPCSADEETVAAEPGELVEKLAFMKAQTVFDTLPPLQRQEAVVVGSDTVVVLDGTIIGKPKDEEDAFRILKSGSGRVNTVYTGLAVVSSLGGSVCHDSAEVRFAELTDREIENYIATGEPMDKAGAYGIQGRFSMFVEGVSGSYFTVVGLPVHMLYRMLAEHGVLPDWFGK